MKSTTSVIHNHWLGNFYDLQLMLACRTLIIRCHKSHCKDCYRLTIKSISCWWYILFQRFYIATSRQLKRLDAKRRSPIFSYFGETLQGMTTIRGYNAKDRFCMVNDKNVDHNVMAYYPNMAANRWVTDPYKSLLAIVLAIASHSSLCRRINLTNIHKT